MLVEGFPQLLRDHSQTINNLASLCFIIYFALVGKEPLRNIVVHILNEINNKNYPNLTSFFPVKAVTFALKRETQKQCKRNYLFENWKSFVYRPRKTRDCVRVAANKKKYFWNIFIR